MNHTLKSILTFTFILIVMATILLWTDKRDKELMKINYCWDQNGEHYVAPDERCTHGAYYK